MAKPKKTKPPDIFDNEGYDEPVEVIKVKKVKERLQIGDSKSPIAVPGDLLVTVGGEELHIQGVNAPAVEKIIEYFVQYVGELGGASSLPTDEPKVISVNGESISAEDVLALQEELVELKAKPAAEMTLDELEDADVTISVDPAAQPPE